MYTLGTFLVLFSSYLLLKALEKPKFSLWLAYAITVAACAYTHYFLLFSLAAQGIFWFFYVLAKYKFSFLKAREFLMGAGSYILAGLLYVPWLPSFFEQRTRVASGYWIGKPDQWAVPGTIWKMTFGGQGTNHTVLAITSVIALMIIGYFIAKVRGSGKWLVFLSVFVPFAAALVMSYTTSIYQDRYFVFASLFFAILIALALLQIPRYSMKSVLVSVFVIITVVAFYKNWRDLDVKNLFTNREINNKPGMAKAASIVNEQSQPNDKIFVASSFVYFTFQYYYNGYNHTWNKNQDPKWPLLLSDIPLSQIPHFSGTAILSEEDLQPTTNGGLVPQNAVNKNSNAWVVWTTGFGGSKPNIPGNWSQVGEWEAPDTPGFKGSIFVTEYHVK